jgi:two-component system chemotaxis response regulator CheB
MRVLIVDDSALMRRHLVSLLSGYELATARNGREALEQLDSFCPDVITLDINMPELDGLSALSMIMLKRPTPVVMVSSLTERGALATLEALNLGAVDFIAKPDGSISLRIDEIAEDLRRKVAAAAKARLGAERSARTARSAPARIAPRAAAGNGQDTYPIVLVGVSTGGPRTLEDVLTALPANFGGALVIAQHMPENFTAALAARLDKACAISIREVAEPTPLEPGVALIARGGADLLLSSRAGRLYALPCPAHDAYLWHPSVERLVASAMTVCSPRRLVGVMLTGMGSDGAQAMTELYRAGGKTIAESESTAVVFGMPAELIRRDGAARVLPCDAIAEQLTQWTQQREDYSWLS